MKSAGYFKQLRHGDANGPDLKEAISQPMPEEMRGTVAHYLRECPVLAATSQHVDDVLDPSQRSISRIDMHTDGQWDWPEDLAYYVEVYGAQPPAELTERATTLEPPKFEHQELVELEQQFFDDLAQRRHTSAR